MDETNNTEEGDEMMAGFSVKFDVFPIVLAVLIIVFNSFVLILVIKRKQLRNQANYLLCSLALSDLLTGLVDIPLFLACNITWDYPLCLVAENCLRMTSISTVLHLVAITVDRYLAATYALQYPSIVTPARSHAVKGAIWLVSIVLAFIQLAWSTSNSDVNEEGNVEYEVPYDITSLVVFFAVPVLVMIVLYSLLFYNVVRSARRRRNSLQRMDVTQRNSKEWQTALVFILMFLSYCACWLPYFLIRLQYNLGNEFFVLPHIAEYIFIYLRFLGSFLNPCIYVFGKNDFRKALRATLTYRKIHHLDSGMSDIENTVQMSSFS